MRSVLVSGRQQLLCCPQMFRWTAKFLLLVMLAPGFEPLAMASAAHAAPAEAMHCMRQPMSSTRSVHAAQPTMQCHHAMAQSNPPRPESPVESSEASFHAVDNCCQNHNCCCCNGTPEWAQPAFSLLSFVNLLIEPARVGQSAVLQSSNIFGQDSARAPPRS
jgi:hypothetical protein